MPTARMLRSPSPRPSGFPQPATRWFPETFASRIVQVPEERVSPSAVFKCAFVALATATLGPRDVRVSRLWPAAMWVIVLIMKIRKIDVGFKLAVLGLMLSGLAHPLAAAEPTALSLIKEGNRYVGEDVKDQVVQIRSDKSVGGLTPNVW